MDLQKPRVSQTFHQISWFSQFFEVRYLWESWSFLQSCVVDLIFFCKANKVLKSWFVCYVSFAFIDDLGISESEHLLLALKAL